jgi:peptidoglycan/xylan/chitin deacetylase (PgdA/CDA1 family)
MNLLSGGEPPASGERDRRTGLHLIGTSPVALTFIAAAIIAGSIAIFGFSGWSLGVPLVVIAAAFLDGVFRPGSGTFFPVVTHGPRNGGRVALTFDDGPDPEVTPQVLDTLARHDAHATFFVIGRKLGAQPELARRILAEGHELANHSWQHSRWINLRRASAHRREILRGAETIAAFGQNDMALYRPPVGLKSPHLGSAARRLGLAPMIAWSLHSHDSRGKNPERIARRVLNKVRAGDIILMHDGHDRAGNRRPVCAESLDLILRGLEERTLESVTASQLLNVSCGQKKTGAEVAASSSHPKSLQIT